MIHGLDPSKIEKRHVWRAILIQDVMIISEEDLWANHPIAFRALVTMRLCMDAIQRLIDGQHEVNAGFVKAVVMQGDDMDGEVPFMLDEMAEYLMTDEEARRWWQSQIADSRYPHRCPFCSAAAYIGFNQIECRALCRD